jgi:pseudouridine-5'-phosphate glycosidase
MLAYMFFKEGLARHDVTAVMRRAEGVVPPIIAVISAHACITLSQREGEQFCENLSNV